MRKRLVIGLVVVVVLVGGAMFLVRGRGFTSRRSPFPLEEQVARAARRFLVPSDVRDAVSAVANTPEARRAGLEHFADHCASCHANDGSGDISLGRSLFPQAPDMRAGATQAMSDGELFYVIEQGIPLTWMPAWGTGTPDGERSSWELVLFIRHLPNLTSADIQEMERLNPRSPAEDKRDMEIDDFLSGRTSIR